MPESLSLDSLKGVSETLLIPLFGRVLEYEEPRALLKDEFAHQLGMRLIPLMQDSPDYFHQGIVRRRWPKSVQVMMALRTLHFDRLTAAFLERHPDGQVVLLGCGLDSRYQRLGCPDVDWVNLDLAAVMQLRQQIFPSYPRVRELTLSALNPAWLQAIDIRRPTIVLAEGLLMYLPRDQIRYLFRLLAENLRGEFVAEVVSQYALPMLNHFLLRRSLHLKTEARFAGGICSPREPESWHPRLHWLSNWTYDAAREPRLGLLNLSRYTPFAYTHWLTHYRLGAE